MGKQGTGLEINRNVSIQSGNVVLDGELKIPKGAAGVVLFAHGSGSSRSSSRNQFVAQVLRDAGVGTLLFDLLTKDEELVDTHTGHLRFDIRLLANRLIDATHWFTAQPELARLSVGYFGSSTGAAAAFVAAAELGNTVAAVVSRGGRPDLAGKAIGLVKSPTLLIVGGNDDAVVELNQRAYARIRCEKELKIVPGATHLFEEPGTLEQVANLASEWFREMLQIRSFGPNSPVEYLRSANNGLLH